MICELEFEEGEKVFSSCPIGIQLTLGALAVFKSNGGEEMGKIIKILNSGKVSTAIIRLANQEDIENNIKNEKEKTEIYKLCREKEKEIGIPIKVISTHIQFDKSLLKVKFLAKKRIGLKRLMHELAKIYKGRIEFHQIGVRTYAKRFDAFGVCGKRICCATFLKEFEPITIGTIKLQSLSCGTGKLTGVCGRLMCCLAYEKKHYEEEKKRYEEEKKSNT